MVKLTADHRRYIFWRKTSDYLISTFLSIVQISRFEMKTISEMSFLQFFAMSNARILLLFSTLLTLCRYDGPWNCRQHIASSSYPTYSVTRLVDFWKFPVTNYLIQVV